MTVLFLDTETYCPIPIKNGTHAYAAQAEVMIVTWALDDGPVQTEDLTDPQPDGSVRLRKPSGAFQRALMAASEVVIHKSDFDRTVLRHALGLTIEVERVHDTMVRAMAHSLPGSLDKLCDIMGVEKDKAKDKEGGKYIQLFCKPLPKTHKLRRATRATHPVEWGRFLEYAGSDILAMRELYRKLPRWNYQGSELALWRLDQRINDRGFAVDVELAQTALAAVADEQRALASRARALTQQQLASTRQRDALLKYILESFGVDLPDMKASTLERRIADDQLPWALRELLSIRLQATTSSTAKYAAIMRSVSADGRLRGALQFVGALRTGRWSGRLFQPQNLPRPDMEQEEIDEAIAALKAHCLDLIADNVMRAASNCIRGLIVASPGKRLYVSDLEQIEARTAPWLAGEQWKLDAFAEYDEGRGYDNYVLAYARAFGVDPASVTKAQRQIGKVMELALGYEGGVGSWLAFALVYGIDLEAMAADAYPNLPDEARKNAEGMLEWRKRKKLTTYGLSDRVFIVCEAFKALWRQAHPEISSYWKELEKAALKACANPGVTVECRRLKFRRVGAWLRMILPSGRSLCYPSPKVDDGKLTYMGVNQYTRKWQPIHTYGGKLFENACQAVARDVMAHNMPAIENAGYEIILSVHDELLTEGVDDGTLTSDNLSELLATNPPWMTGCPLAAGGFDAPRYRKD